MKRTIILIALISFCSSAFAQKKDGAVKEQPRKELPAPFKGGIDTMFRFFKDNFTVSPQIIKAKASGLAIFKLTADNKGMITSIVVYYADDYLLTQPAIDALRRTNGKWVIPGEVRSYDFIVQFSINYKPLTAIRPAALKSILDYYQHHTPINATDQVPLNYATLLPTIIVNYE